MRQIARHGQEKRYYHARLGVNSRLDTIQAAILLPKLRVLDWEISQRNKLAENYTKAFAKQNRLSCPKINHDITSAWAQYTLKMVEREKFQEFLKLRGIPTAIHYPMPLNKQPAVVDQTLELPISEKLSSQVVSLPMHGYMTSENESHIISTVSETKFRFYRSWDNRFNFNIEKLSAIIFGK